MWSIAAAKEYIGKSWIPFYNETVAKSSGAKWYALRGGSNDGVFTSVTAMLQVKQEGGGVHDVFESEEKARSFVDSANATTEWYVVWEGRQTGVLGEAEMLAATRGVESVIEGPMSKADADLIWTGKAEKVT